MSELTAAHETVLLQEAVDALVTNPEGVYIDATFGRGGHSRLILDRLGDTGKLIAIDKDIDAVNEARSLFGKDDRFEIVHGSFADLEQHLAQQGLVEVDGVLADLGVSSPQLDNADRGFSFMKDGPLDMRMDRSRGMSASEWLSATTEQELVQVLRDYGEEKFAKRIAGAIKAGCQTGPIKTTLELANLVKDANPSWEKHKHPATRAFQAIRIKVNNELLDLESLLENAAKSLALNGRLVMISFHSLEDRIVKRFMRGKVKGNVPPPNVPVFEKDIVRHFKTIGKALKPSDKEVSNNIRARSAVMRILEKISNE
ncbi:MAG: 16S rRNA (cytosine(1402)-N(4))-methyltransferase RsmH [Oleiphilus sp.]